MNGFLRRINRLIKQIEPLGKKLLTLIYVDGMKRKMKDDVDVFSEIMSGRVKSFYYHNEEDDEDGFYSALMAGCHDINELFKDGDDSDMLPAEGVE